MPPNTVAIIGWTIALLIAAVVLISFRSDYLVWDRDTAAMTRLLKQKEVRIIDLPVLVEAMSRGTASTRYAALIFGTPDRPSDEDTLNVQVSIENGKAGFDWVLLAPRNIEDQGKFKAFARVHSVEPISHSMNGVSYLRVECPDVAKFAASVVTEMYHHPSNEPLGLVYEGFEWSPS